MPRATGRCRLGGLHPGNAESSSCGAARHCQRRAGGGAAGYFEDVAPAVIELPGCEPTALADGICAVMGWLPGEWQDYWARSQERRTAHAHSVVAQRLSGMIAHSRALVRVPYMIFRSEVKIWEVK